MSIPEPHPTLFVARPNSGDERGWLALVLDLLPIPALVIEPSAGGVVVANPSARALLEATDRHLAPGEPPGPRQLLLVRLAADAAGEQGTVVTWPMAAGEARFRVHARAVPPADGEGVLTLLSFLDETAREAAERELRSVIEARDEFFSVATHELKDPLFSIQLSLQLLRHATEKQGPVPPHVAHHLDVCGRQSDRLARIIDNLLDVSRIQGNRLRLDPEVIDLSELAREALTRLRETARSAGSELSLDAHGPVIGYFDRLKLDQVLSNLLANAMKYGAGRPVVVRVREEGSAAVVEVEDHGPGVAPADHERIFARFERASGWHQKESLGLGLYIVRSIAEAHGGTVTVRSELGRGATFTLTLPRNRLSPPGDGAGDRGHEPGGAA